MKSLFTTIGMLFILVGCNVGEEIQALEAGADERKVWIFGQFNVPEEGDKIDSYYYFGRISHTLYNKIATNSIQSGFIILENVKYWGNDDIIYNYRDKENHGEIVFRIEDIRRLKRVNVPPVAGKGYEQYEEEEAAAEAESSEDSVENAPANAVNET